MNRLRLDQSHPRFQCHHERDHGQRHCAGEAAEHTDLAGAERVPPVVGVATRIGVGKGRDPESRDVGAHVPAIGQQGHGAKGRPGNDFHDHHGEGEPDHAPGVPFAFCLNGVETVLVLPIG